MASMDEKPPTLKFVPPIEDANQDPPPAYNGPLTEGTSLDVKRSTSKEKETDINVNVRSVNSSTSSVEEFSDLLLPDVVFTPGRSFHVAARGIGAIRLPVPSSQLEIDIYNADGTVAYTSTRARRSKGDCVLATPDQGDLVSTNYFFGPKPPIIQVLGGEDNFQDAGIVGVENNDGQDEGVMQIQSKWTSRTITMVHRVTGQIFEWSYEQRKTKDGKEKKKANLLVLRLKDSQSHAGMWAIDDESDGKGKVLAQLIRSKQTRTPGTNGCTAGNGGRLVLDQDAAKVLDEPLIVATCLMMLKKEIDRRRALQFVMISAAAGGGGG